MWKTIYNDYSITRPPLFKSWLSFWKIKKFDFHLLRKFTKIANGHDLYLKKVPSQGTYSTKAVMLGESGSGKVNFY